MTTESKLSVVPDAKETETNLEKTTPIKVADPAKEAADKAKLAELAIQMSKANNELFLTREEALASTTTKNRVYPCSTGLAMITHMMVDGSDILVERPIKDLISLEPIHEGILEYKIANKLPFDLFKEVIASFKDIFVASGDEAAAQIYKDVAGKYYVYYPLQRQEKASVSYGHDPHIAEIRATDTLVMELHSHNSMGAFWSGTDDSNEQDTGLYIVIGQFGTTTCAYKCRLKHGPYAVDLSLTDVFTCTEEEAKAALTYADIAKGPGVIETKIDATREIPAYTSYYGTNYGTGYGTSYYGGYEHNYGSSYRGGYNNGYTAMPESYADDESGYWEDWYKSHGHRVQQGTFWGKSKSKKQGKARTRKPRYAAYDSYYDGYPSHYAGSVGDYEDVGNGGYYDDCPAGLGLGYPFDYDVFMSMLNDIQKARLVEYVDVMKHYPSSKEELIHIVEGSKSEYGKRD